MTDRMKGITSVEALERYLNSNPEVWIEDRRDNRESRFILKSDSCSFISTVDGRSVRAIYGTSLSRRIRPCPTK